VVGLKSADHAGGRGHSFAQCRTPATSRSFRLSAAVQYFKGVPSPVKHPEKVNMVISAKTRRHYAGLNTPPARRNRQKISIFFAKEFRRISTRSVSDKREASSFGKKWARPKRPDVMIGIGIKPVSRSGSVRLIHSAISYAILNQRKSVTLVHKGNIMKFTEGAFRDWGLRNREIVFRRGRDRWRSVVQDSDGKTGAGIVIKRRDCDITLQQVLTRPEDFDVIATLNLNGDYLSDALAAQVGGIWQIAPGGNIINITVTPF